MAGWVVSSQPTQAKLGLSPNTLQGEIGKEHDPSLSRRLEKKDGAVGNEQTYFLSGEESYHLQGMNRQSCLSD